VRVNEAPPCSAELGEIWISVGTGSLTATPEAAEVPPPGAGFVTVTWNVPALAMSEALMVAVILVAFTKVVVRGDPAQFTTEVLTKFVPFTVRVNAAPPASALLGASEVMLGLGLSTTKASEPDTPPPGLGLVAVMRKVPALVRSVAGTEAISSLLVLKTVLRAEPFQFTVAPLTKFVPFTVNVKDLDPRSFVVGDNEVSVGTGLLTVKGKVWDVPPPGVGFDTLTG